MCINRNGLFFALLFTATIALAATAGAAGVAGSSVSTAWDVPAYSTLNVKLTTGPAITETAFRDALGSAFDSIDTNHDGKISFAEALAAYPNLTQDVFYTVDTNGDGFITKEELEASGCAGCSSSATDAKKRLGDLFLAGLSLSMLAAFSRRK